MKKEIRTQSPSTEQSVQQETTVQQPEVITPKPELTPTEQTLVELLLRVGPRVHKTREIMKQMLGDH